MTIFVKNNTAPEDDDKDSILTWNAKYGAYKNEWPYEQAACFIGDVEDYCNTNLKNFNIINKKYGTNYDFFQLKLHYELNPAGNPIIAYNKIKNASNKMPKGIYQLVQLDFSETGFKPLTVNTEKYVDFNNFELQTFETKIKDFFNRREEYAKLGTRHKGATLLYGPPGCGKTSSVLKCVKDLANSKYIVFVTKGMSLSNLNEYKEVFAGEDIIIVLEEITERLGHGTEDLLNFLDGYSSWDNCYVIATTNHPEQLPANLANRPGRFNNLFEIKLPTDEQKTIFLKEKNFTDEEIAKILPKTKDFSVDEIAQLAIHSKLEKMPLDIYLKTLDENKKKAKNAFKGKGSMGIQ